MPRDPHKSTGRATAHDERETAAHHHSAFEEFRRDERRPAVLLLGALVIAAVFFAFGIMLGRWMADADNNNASRSPASNTVKQPSATPVAPQPTP
jgi:hypothetical protein